ncbi:MAG: hypothetical protein CMM94_01880 [Rickettsiales bacterium]|nr:hypothetical protein [Rickettsiales bacterium]
MDISLMSMLSASADAKGDEKHRATNQTLLEGTPFADVMALANAKLEPNHHHKKQLEAMQKLAANDAAAVRMPDQTGLPKPAELEAFLPEDAPSVEEIELMLADKVREDSSLDLQKLKRDILLDILLGNDPMKASQNEEEDEEGEHKLLAGDKPKDPLMPNPEDASDAELADALMAQAAKDAKVSDAAAQALKMKESIVEAARNTVRIINETDAEARDAAIAAALAAAEEMEGGEDDMLQVAGATDAAWQTDSQRASEIIAATPVAAVVYDMPAKERLPLQLLPSVDKIDAVGGAKNGLNAANAAGGVMPAAGEARSDAAGMRISTLDGSASSDMLVKSSSDVSAQSLKAGSQAARAQLTTENGEVRLPNGAVDAASDKAQAAQSQPMAAKPTQTQLPNAAQQASQQMAMQMDTNGNVVRDLGTTQTESADSAQSQSATTNNPSNASHAMANNLSADAEINRSMHQGTDAAKTVKVAHGATPGDQVGVTIKQAVNAGQDRIIVQLDPADLGRVEIKMEVQDGRAHVVVTADSKDTLELLQRDARQLERSLQEAGIEADANEMEFNLQQESQRGDEESEQAQHATRAYDGAAQVEEEMQYMDAMTGYYTLTVSNGLDIQA